MEDCDYSLRSGNSFPLDGTFRSCPRQSAQLCSLDIDLGSTSHENYIYSIPFAVLQDKKGNNILLFVTKNYKRHF
jgi:hypothetical protein